MQGEWSSRWISHADDARQDLGVWALRRSFTLERIPGRLDVRVSADQRYKLYVNGQMIGFGPQRGDPQHWFYETYNLTPFLREGQNVVVALVWNFGWLAPMAQLSARTGFLLDDLEFETLSTPSEWEVTKLEGWNFDKLHNHVGDWYIDIGPGEIVDARIRPDAIAEIGSLDWRKAHIISTATERGAGGGGTPWMLLPRSIPPMRYELRESRPVRRYGFAEEQDQAHGALMMSADLSEDSGHGGAVLLDYGELLCAYPRITAKGSGTITVTYAEALWQEDGLKGNRDDVNGKRVRGYQDKFILSEEAFTFEPLWWRTYRYLLIEAEGDAVIETIDAVETGYPLESESSFEADDPSVKPLWDVSLRTAQRCAGETYFDCPYYEQLQYAGDTRIQALIGYYLSSDRALQRNAIKYFHWSTLESGLTQSRYPSRQAQVIPPFSLWWVAMMADQRLYDRVGMRPFEQSSRIQRLDSAIVDLLGRPERSFWNFADWVPEWPAGVPPEGIRSTIHLLTQFYANLLNVPDILSAEEDEDDEVNDWMEHERMRFSDFEKIDGLVRREEEPPSEHAEALYRLCQIVLGEEPDPWPFSALERVNAAKCTYYFSYYKHLAMQPEDYLSQLGPWREMIEDGLTTFAENPDPVRSDCHAWSAHPILGFFQLIAGVTSVATGWRKCRIQPRPGSLKRFDARIAHPDGELRVAFEDGLLTVDSPVKYELRWKGRSEVAQPGRAVYR